MPTVSRSGWTRQQLLVAFALYCRMPFGRLHSRNPEIMRIASAIGRTPSALAMKLVNIASLDPEITDTGRSGLKNASANDRAMWDELQENWDGFAVKSDRAIRDMGAVAERLGGEVPGENSDFPVGKDRAVPDYSPHWAGLLPCGSSERVQRAVLYFRVVSAQTARGKPHRSLEN